MMQYGFSQLKSRTLSGETFVLPTASGEAVSAKSAEVSLSLTDKEQSLLEKRVYLPQFIYSAAKGESLGRVEYLIGENIVASSDIISAESTDAPMPKSALGAIFLNFKMLLKAMI